MSQERLAPQQPADCLVQSRKSRCKGGTVIADEVWTLAEHRQRGTEGYREWLHGCPKCGHPKLHVHDYRQRKALGLMRLVVVTVVRFICVNPQCRATWQVLPAFLARHLWWTWRTVEEQTTAEALESTPDQSPATATAPEMAPAVGASTERVPSTRTRQRWLERLRASAAQLVQLMKSRAGKTMGSVVGALRTDSTRADSDDRWVVIDGYKRIRGLHRLAQDTVWAVAWEMDEGVALMLEQLMHTGDGHDPLQQGWLLQELSERFRLSVAELGKRFDKSPSWVSVCVRPNVP